jgi:hypothetical protein
MSKALLILIVFTFLGLTGGGVWKQIQMAIAPPIYDPISYYSRAQLFWSAVGKSDFHGILNGPMAIRPPGTALILYPFGFRNSVHSFLFRSVIVPILIWVVALSIPVANQLKGWSDALLGGSLVVGLATMPLFYQFEYNETFYTAYKVMNQWGMVDSLEASLAALAVSLLCFGIVVRSVPWCAFGWIVSVFSFFVKPSGSLVMMSLIAIAAVEFGILFFENGSGRRAVVRFAFIVYAIAFCLFGVAFWLALKSDYMSHEVIGQAIKASQYLISMYQGRELVALLAMFIVPVVGWWWLCPGMLYFSLIVVETIQSVLKRQGSSVGAQLAVVGFLLVAAVCWWIFLAGQQHRYLFPFILLSISWFVPDIFRRIRALGPSAKGGIIGYCLAPAFLLIGLLWSKEPPINFQQLMGINLSAGGFGAEVNQAKWLLAESERLGRPLNLYSIGNYRAGALEMVDWVKSIENNNSPHRFSVKRPLNWVDSPGLRADEMVQSDFLLLEDIPVGVPGETATVSDWPEEVQQFKRFAYSSHDVDKNGLVLVSDGEVKVFRVADPHKFSESLYRWANSIRWKNDFRERNRAFLEKVSK